MKYYRINISGRGGEFIFGKATLQQYNFWNDSEQLMDAGFDEDDASDALVYYMQDKDEWESNIPKLARFEYEWYEIDDYGHYHGATVDTAYIEVNEVDSSEYSAKTITEVYDGTVEKLIDKNDVSVVATEFELDDVLEDKPPFVFYAASIEKGGFLSGTIELDDDVEFDISKLVFYTEALPTGDTLITNIEYDGEEVDNNGGDTTGKAMYMEVWEW